MRPGRDNIHNCLYLFREMWKARPELVAKYPELATAVAVVWDNSPEVAAQTGKVMKGAPGRSVRLRGAPASHGQRHAEEPGRTAGQLRLLRDHRTATGSAGTGRTCRGSSSRSWSTTARRSRSGSGPSGTTWPASGNVKSWFQDIKVRRRDAAHRERRPGGL